MPSLPVGLVQGFISGFRIKSTLHATNMMTRGYGNHSSADVHSAFVSAKLDREIAIGRIAGPFPTPTPNDLVISPLGVVPKKVCGEYRLIHDLSFPKNNSVNSHIDKSHTEVHYELLDHCVSIIHGLGTNCLIAKAESKMLSVSSPFIQTTIICWVSCGKVNNIMTNVFQWDVAHHARHLKCLPWLCSGYSHRN